MSIVRLIGDIAKCKRHFLKTTFEHGTDNLYIENITCHECNKYLLIAQTLCYSENRKSRNTNLNIRLSVQYSNVQEKCRIINYLFQKKEI